MSDETPDATKNAEAKAAETGTTTTATPDAAPVKRRGRPRRGAVAEVDEGEAAPERTKPRTVDSDEPSLGWTVQSGTAFRDSDALPGQILPPELAADQPVVGGALYVEDDSHPDGYQQLVQ